MGYGVKWVETHLGVSRKALRNFEEHGLMPKHKNQNRDYDKKDLEIIWGIRVLQGMGFTISEIVSIRDQAQADENFSLQPFMGEKIKELEKDIAEKQKHLGYAKTIKLLGRFPAFPKEIGKETCDEFREKSIEGWNLEVTEEDRKYMRLAEIMLSDDLSSINDVDVGRIFEQLIEMLKPGSKMNYAIELNVLLQGLVDRADYQPRDPKIQALVELIHDHFVRTTKFDFEITSEMFARQFSHAFIQGDQGALMAKRYGSSGCAFAADAIAIYGGYDSYRDLCDEALG